jgi:HEAT repeat protein
VRATALGALERLGAASDGDIVAALTDADPGVRRRAATIAARHPGVDLTIALADPDSTVVEVAAWACGERSEVGDEVLHLLISLATDSSTDPLARESSVAALGAIGDERALDAILAATGDKPAIRRRAVLALAPFLDPGHARAGEIDAALQQALTDRDWQVRQAAEDLLPRD